MTPNVASQFVLPALLSQSSPVPTLKQKHTAHPKHKPTFSHIRKGANHSHDLPSRFPKWKQANKGVREDSSQSPGLQADQTSQS